MVDTQDVILAELQGLRRDFNDYARVTGERVSSLETDLKSLMGNGQPGRIAVLEANMSKLVEWRWRVVGCAVGGSGVVSALAWIVAQLHK
jgi:hypothetical protein